MEIKQASRKEVKLRIGISSASGFGKSYSALLMGFGMTQDWSKIAVIDTENSSSLYSELGNFNVLNLSPPYSPERYAEAISICEQSDIQVIIIDSVSAEWNSTGGCLEIHEELGGRFQDWGPVKKRHQQFIDKILQSTCHIITTTRRKMDYSLDVGSNGKTRVVKHGTKEITSDGFEYELSLNFEIINENHLAKASKDRTGLFSNKPEFVINSATGKKLIAWANSSNHTITKSELQQKIEESMTIKELTDLFNNNIELAKSLNQEFVEKKNLIQKLTSNISSNGNTTYP